MTILITGGSSGIGFGIAQSCAKAGHDLLLVARNRRRLELAQRKLRSIAPVNVRIFSADISRPPEVKRVRLFCRAQAAWPDVIVLNAGIFVGGKISRVRPGDIEKIMATNVYSTFSFTREFVSILQRRRQSKMILIGSTAGLEPHKSETYGSLYSVTKFATRGVALNLRRELRSKGIGVTHIAPGSVMTEMWGRDGRPAQMLKPSDIGELVVSLLKLSSKAVVEEIIIRPIGGNI